MLLTLVFTHQLCVYYLQIDPKLFTPNSLKNVFINPLNTELNPICQYYK